MSNDGNQTIFDEFYDGYLEDLKKAIKDYLVLFKDETFAYFQENAQHLAIIILVYFTFCFCFYHLLIHTTMTEQIGKIANCKNVLFVISHPDDECMFFGPTIVNLVEKPGVNVYVLCLSRGDFNRLGNIRKEELFISCKILGIPESNVMVLNYAALRDDPQVRWSQEIVANVILNFIETFSIDTVVTFDQYGVSSHLNHISVFSAMAYLCLEKKLPKECTPYALETVSLPRKYMSYMDITLSYLLSSKMYVVPKEKHNLIHEAMRAHQSQYVWFRKAYMLFSRYTFINSLKEIDIVDIELELDLEDDTG